MSDAPTCCLGCPHLRRRLDIPGPPPEYDGRCAHPDAPRIAIGVPEHDEWMNLRRVPVASVRPSWCPLPRIDDAAQAAGQGDFFMGGQSRILDKDIAISMSLTPALARLIDDLADRMVVDASQVFDQGVFLLKIAVDARDKGHRIAVVDGELEEVVREIRIPAFRDDDATKEATP